MHDDLWVPPVAASQRGAFTRRQALAAGATPAQIRWRVRRGVWLPVLGQVLRSAAAPFDASTQAHAARLTWPDCVVALGTAARIHGLPVPDDGRVHVVVPTGRVPRGVLTPYQFRLDPGDVTHAYLAPVTSRERTILDCLGRLPAEQAMSLLAWVASRRLVSAEAISGWIGRHRGRLGNRARAEAADRLARGSVNPAEDRLHRILRDAGITGWIPNASLAELVGVHAVADVYFPAVRLVVEVDGRAAHGAARFQQDRTRQNSVIAAGCTVLRYTWRDLTERPGQVAAEMTAVLQRLSARRS